MEKPFPSYHGDDPYIFVSYAHTDAHLVFPEMQRLHERGFNLWYDDGIRPGSTWREEVALALTESKLFLFFVTDHSVTSENCHQELNFALSRERKILAVHLTPARLTAGVELSLSNKQAIVRSELSDEAFASKLTDAVRALMPAVMPAAVSPGAIKQEAVDKHSIAILPFANRSSDRENEYLCDGIAEELITGLAKIKGLTVASQLMSFGFKGQSQDVMAIGQKLKAAYVLTGSVQKSGQRVRITATLTETGSGKVAWSERYDGTVDDVFALQEGVANKVVGALQVELVDADGGTAAIIDTGTRSRTAYQHLLLGLHEFNKSTRQGFVAAHIHFEHAVEADPGFGRAYWLDFVTWSLQRDQGFVPQEIYYPAAKAVLERAHKTAFEFPSPPFAQDRWLDPALRVDVRTSARECLELIRSDNTAWKGYSYTILAESLAEAGLLNGACDITEHYLSKYSMQADNTHVPGTYGSLLFALGRFEKAIDHHSALYNADSSRVLSLGIRAMLYSRTGQYAKAQADLAELTKTFPRNFAQFYDLYWRRELDAAAAYFEWLERQKNLDPLFKIWGWFLLGHIDRGMEHLEAANYPPAYIRVECLFALTPSIIRRVTTHPRYRALLATHGLDDAWRDELMGRINELEHLTGIHVALDEDY